MKGKTKNLLIKILIGFVILTILGVFIFLILGKGKKENKENDMMIFRDIVTDDPTSDNILCPSYTGCIPKDNERCHETRNFKCEDQTCQCKDGFDEPKCSKDDNKKCYPKCKENEEPVCDNDQRVCKCITGFDKCGDKCVPTVTCASDATSTCSEDGQFVCVCKDQNQQHVDCNGVKSCVAKCPDSENEYSCEKGCCVCKAEFSDYNYNTGKCQKSTSNICNPVSDIPPILDNFSKQFCSSFQGKCNLSSRYIGKIKYRTKNNNDLYLTLSSSNTNDIILSQERSIPEAAPILWNTADDKSLINFSRSDPYYLTSYGDSDNNNIFKLKGEISRDTNNKNQNWILYIRPKENPADPNEKTKYTIQSDSGLYLTVNETDDQVTVFTTSKNDDDFNGQIWEFIPFKLCQE